MILISSSLLLSCSRAWAAYTYTTAGEILAQSLSQLERNIHPVVIISTYNKALQTALEIVSRISVPIDTSDDTQMLALIKTSIGTKFVVRWSDLMCRLALDAVRTVATDDAGGVRTVDIKRYARVEKVPGGGIEERRVLSGVMLNKDIVHPRIHKPRIVKAMVDRILEFNPDLVITEKGISDYAQYFFSKAKVSALRRVRKSDNNRIARAVGATISDVGTRWGLFNIEKIGDEYFTFLTECTTPKACTILLRGPSKDILNEIDRNLADAMSVARNVVFNPTLVPGGGAVEMAISVGLHGRARAVTGVEAGPFRAVADALEVIPVRWFRMRVGTPSGRSRRSACVSLPFTNFFTFQFCFVPLYLVARVLLHVDDVVQATRKERRQEQGAPPEEPVQE
ncbi:TCP-1/cpn60 chaperonin family-domain-containing protein [Russula dissimulans]|nr:TCP-1/cpn60 chaperonin family-domain-containing protein [Russula dissimulans]